MSVFEISDIFEERRCRRFPMQKDALLLIFPDLQNSYPIKDMSKGGLSFRCSLFQGHLTGLKKLDIFNRIDNVYLEDILLKIGYGLEKVGPSVYRNVGMKRYGGQFVNITRKQKKLLKSFISKYGIS